MPSSPSARAILLLQSFCSFRCATLIADDFFVLLCYPLFSQRILCFSPHYIYPPAINPRHHRLTPSLRSRCRIISGASMIERGEEKRHKELRKRDEVCIRLRLDLQVKFGEQVDVLGSSNELGTWKKHVPMKWTEAGWVCELDLRACETVEFKFLIMAESEKGIAWEEGMNRCLVAPESSFVEQWQGSHVPFMRFNEHRKEEIDRRCDTEGLDGVALELVEGNNTARNWWRKLEVVHAILALDSLTLLDHLGWTKAHVFCHSMGAMVACKLAAMVPGSLLSLALLNATGGGFECFPKIDRQLISLALRFLRAKTPEERAVVDLETHYTKQRV